MAADARLQRGGRGDGGVRARLDLDSRVRPVRDVARVIVAVWRIVLIVSIGMVAAAAASAEVSPDWVRTQIGPRFSVGDLNGRGVGVGGWGGRSHHHALVWEQGKAEPIDLGTFGGNESRAIAINEQSQVIGWSQRSNAAVHAFLWQGGHMRDLGTLGGRRSEPSALNERGQVAGVADTTSGQSHAFLWANGRMRDLGILGGSWSEAKAINARGEVVGISEDGAGRTHAFLWQNGRIRDLGTLGGKESDAVAINDRGQVVGRAETKSGLPHAFLWQAGRMKDLGVLPNLGKGFASEALAINQRGQVVVHVWDDDAVPDFDEIVEMLFLWEKGRLTTVGPEAPFWGFKDLSELGAVVGETGLWDSDNPHAFVWEDGHLTDLGGRRSRANAITANGDRIVGRVGITTVLWTRKPS
jgi:probable HAF family extracellular repeat protein